MGSLRGFSTRGAQRSIEDDPTPSTCSRTLKEEKTTLWEGPHLDDTVSL